MDLLGRVTRTRAPQTGAPGVSTHNRAAGGHPLLALQRSAGNAAVSNLLAREPGDDDGPAPAPAEIRTLADIDALTVEQVAAIDVQSLVPYRIIHDVFHQNWHYVKEALVSKPPADKADVRNKLMEKLIAYREWHHKQIIREVAAEMNEGLGEQDKKALDPDRSKGGGSDSLTSDIDVNLKGTTTEMAVAKFNQAFKRPKSVPGHDWDFEPGVVYDVNVYALDFLHLFGTVQQDGHAVTVKEGAREQGGAGGVQDAELAADDRIRQLAVSLFKARLYMTDAQYRGYIDRARQGVADTRDLTRADVMARGHYRRYLEAMAKQMDEKLEFAVDRASSGVAQLQARAIQLVPGAEGENEHHVDAKRQDTVMAAANRIYETKLVSIREQRQVLKDLLTRLGTTEDATARAAIERIIDLRVNLLRDDISEAAMYANEASMTDAAVSHGVLGIQGGRRIEQPKHEGIEAVNEHVADLHKETAHYDGWEAIFKGGKYLMRLADAARNLGFGYVHGVKDLYDVGWKISTEIKGHAGKKGHDVAAESADAVRAQLGLTEVDQVLAYAREIAALVLQEYQNERSAERGPGGSGDTATAYGFATPPEKTQNTHMGNQQMTHPVDRAAGSKLPTYTDDLAAGLDALWQFRLTEEELDRLRGFWALPSGS